MQNCITGQREWCVPDIIKALKESWGADRPFMRVILRFRKILQPHSGTIL